MRRRDLRFALAVVAAGVLVLVFSLLVQTSATELRPEQALSDPTAAHPFGTDALGRDVLARTLVGLRYTLLVALGAAFIAHALGMPLGLLAAIRGGRLERIVVRATTLQMSLPPLLFLLLILFTLAPGMWTTMVALGLNSWMVFARYYRSVGHQLNGLGYVAASRGLGASTLFLLRRHFLPNALAPAVPLILVEVGRLMLAEAAISFLGFGVQPPGVSVGLVLAEGRVNIATAPWISGFAGLVLCLSVLCLSVFSNRVESNLSRNATRGSKRSPAGVLKEAT